MTDDFDDGDNVTYIHGDEPPRRPRSKSTDKAMEKDRKRRSIPVLPSMKVTADEVLATGDVTKRDEAIVAAKIAGATYADIARLFELPSAHEAQKIFVQTLARTHPQDTWDTTRALVTATAEQQLERAIAMARADYFHDAEDPDELIPNDDKLRWHSQASADLAFLAALTGVKAPTRVEITPTDLEYQQLVERLLEAEGHRPVREVNILELTEIPEVDDGGTEG